MKKFNEWLSLRETDDFVKPQTGEFRKGYHDLDLWWHKHKNSLIQFQGEQGVMTGRLISSRRTSFLDSFQGGGVFVVQDEQGQEHDINPQQIVGVQQQSAPITAI
jgi:hypothetical protein